MAAMSHAHGGVADDEIPAHILERRWVILGVLCTSLLIIVIGNTSLNVALPEMSTELGMSTSAQQWVVDAYALLFAGLLFTAGTLGDRFGRKGFLQAGVVLFGLASAYTTFFADSAAEVIASRAVMGIGGALVMPATLSILVNCFPARERPKAIAIWAAFAGGGGAVGLVLGGWLVEHFWWGSAFAINIPVTAAVFVLGAVLVPSSRDRNPSALDPIGAILSIAGLGVFVYGLIEGPHHGWLSTVTLGTLALGLALIGLFAAWELRSRAPMLDVRLFKNPNFSISALGMTLVFLTLFGFFFVVTQLFQLVLGYGPFEAGLRSLPMMPLMVVASSFSAAMAQRYGARIVITIGMIGCAAGVYILSGLTADSGYAHVLLGMCPMAAGMGLTMPPMTTLIMSSVPPDKAGVGSAMNDTTRELGTTLGVAVLGSILSSGYAANLGSAADAAPAESRHLVEESLAGALAVGRQMGGDAGARLMVAARDAWAEGMRISLLIGAGIIVLAAVVTYRFLPRTADEPVIEFVGDLPEAVTVEG